MSKLKRSIYRGFWVLALMGAIVNTATATITNASCHFIAQGLPWSYSDIPNNPPAGFVIARRTVILNITYQKTGINVDEFLTGGFWNQSGSFNSTYNTVSIAGLPGVGIRFSPQRNPQEFITKQLNLSTAAYIGPYQNERIQDYYLTELVITDAKAFKGGTGTQADGQLFLLLRTRFTQLNPSSLPSCSFSQTIGPGEALTIAGEPLKPIPPPNTPTCTATAQNLNFTVALPPVTTSSLLRIGDVSGTTATNLVLTDCAANATPYVTFTDNNDRTNRSSRLTLSADSVAAGVGVEMISGNNPIQLGAQDTTVSPSNTGQLLIGTSSSDGSTLSLPLQVHYIRTGTIKPGPLKAGAIVTIVYP